MVATADKREFLKISQAVGFGFLIMGAIGYFIKLSMLFRRSRRQGSGQFANSENNLTVHVPVNRVLVGGA
jgi:protein transport protein SEC61 subunit gamma-like protein